jgi:SAM-dependent methyltransferase
VSVPDAQISKTILDRTLENGQSKMSWEEAVLWLKSQPEQIELVRACFFDDPLNASADRYYASTEWRAVRELIGMLTGRALDLGSGRGISAYALARDGWQTTALEPNPSSEVGAGAIHRLASETGIDIRIVENWGEELPFASDSFDLVLGRQVLHHARDLRQLCREAARVLKPNGTFIAIREHVLSRSGDLKLFLDRHPLHRLYGGENAFELHEYAAAITNAGIRLTKTMNPLESDINLYPDSRS